MYLDSDLLMRYSTTWTWTPGLTTLKLSLQTCTTRFAAAADTYHDLLRG
jgi:hypothetical protein